MGHKQKRAQGITQSTSEDIRNPSNQSIGCTVAKVSSGISSARTIQSILYYNAGQQENPKRAIDFSFY